MAQFTHSLCEEVIRTEGVCGLTRNEMVQLANLALRVLRPAGEPLVTATLIWEAIKVLESCESKLEYLGWCFKGKNFTDRPSEDGSDCLHRAYKARDIISTLRSRVPSSNGDSHGS